MSDNLDSTGVPMDSDETADPSDNPNSPDPLLNEAPQAGTPSGALSKVGSQEDKQGRVSQGRDAMNDLRSQFTRDQGMASDAYAAQRKTLENATQRLLATPAGPSPQEAAYRIAAAVGTGDSRGSFNPAGISAAHAQILQEQREQELQKQQLMQQYGMQIPQAQLGAANANINRDVQLMRIQASQNNSAETQADKAPKVTNKYYTPDPTDPTKMVFNQSLYDTDMQANKDKADIAAKAKVWAAQSQVGVIPPEVVEYVQKNQTLPPGFSRNMQYVAKAWQLAHDKNVAEGNDPGAAYAQAQANKALVPALGQLSKQQAMLGSFEANAEKNADMALGFSNQVDRTGVPVFNRWLQAGRTAVAGDTTAAQFQAAHNTFISEYAKIMSGSMGNVATTDAASKHAQDMLSTAMTKDQYAGVVATLRQEMHNRMQTLEATRQGMLKQMQGGPNPSAAPASPTNSALTQPQPAAAPNALLDKWAPAKPAGT